MNPKSQSLVDTHCHIHWADYGVAPDKALAEASADGVSRLICVGTTLADSELAIDFAKKHKNCWASVGVHPHDAKDYISQPNKLRKLADLAKSPKVVAIGETGLDYHYNHSPPEIQQELFKFQLNLAAKFNLPVIFHVRESFDDFWQILSDFPDVKGVLHSFSAPGELDKAIKKGLYIGVNGIVTFAKDESLMRAVKNIPLNKLLLETDAPFLTPTPYRGTICQPKHVLVVAEFLSRFRGESLEELAVATTKNAQSLFSIK